MLLAGLCESFQNMCLKIYMFDSAFSYYTLISIDSNFQKAKVKLKLLGKIDMSLMVNKGVRSGICLVIYNI